VRRCRLPSLLAILLLVFLAASPVVAASPVQAAGPSGRTSPPAAGTIRREPASGAEFVWAPGGVLPPNDPRQARDPYYGDDPERLRRIGGFWIGRFEVTQAQWERVMGANPSAFSKSGAHPVEQVSLPEVREFLRRLNTAGGARFRLPCGTEWLYAATWGARDPVQAAAAKLKRAAGWNRENSGGATRPVGGLPANALGLYDMEGNVSEWCGPCAGDSGEGGLAGFYGGSWAESPKALNMPGLGLDEPGWRRNTVGLRLVLEP